MSMNATNNQLEQLGRLRSEDTPRRPMITQKLLTSSFWIPIPYYWPVHIRSQVKVKAEKLEKLAKNWNLGILL